MKREQSSEGGVMLELFELGSCRPEKGFDSRYSEDFARRPRSSQIRYWFIDYSILSSRMSKMSFQLLLDSRSVPTAGLTDQGNSVT